MFNEIYFTLSVGCALLIWLLDYALGQPSNEEWNEKAILSFWPYWLAKKRAIKNSIWEDSNFAQDEKKIRYHLFYHAHITYFNNFKKVLYMETRPFFTWEKAVGLCTVCTHFWFTLISFFICKVFFFHTNYIIFTIYFLISHFFIRLLKKFI